ncbi:Rim9p [Ascoidea rubescens DSM 1968]|uniref:Pali-domain-containing protein n=1 Tax=Ascoidea rubescens DSM 1968 TaxID=1344418 RepID=A0A1D2VDG6_9ASCO|nr:pali-domain-containing protein [Ascoidea rubescens DSM 1968]ODV59639.1 pali-domain-containing protein [Ascoidea rubescens DSM 1968]
MAYQIASTITILLIISSTLQLISVLSVPISQNITLCRYDGYRFGVFGICNNNGVCSSISIGYSDDSIIDELSGFSLPSNARHVVSRLLIVHPISTGFTLILLILSILIHFNRFKKNLKLLFFLLLWTLPTFLLSLLSFLVDILLFIPHLGWAGWIILPATVLIALASGVICVLRRSISSRIAMDNQNFLFSSQNQDNLQPYRLNSYKPSDSFSNSTNNSTTNPISNHNLPGINTNNYNNHKHPFSVIYPTLPLPLNLDADNKNISNSNNNTKTIYNQNYNQNYNNNNNDINIKQVNHQQPMTIPFDITHDNPHQYNSFTHSIKSNPNSSTFNIKNRFSGAYNINEIPSGLENSSSNPNSNNNHIIKNSDSRDCGVTIDFDSYPNTTPAQYRFGNSNDTISQPNNLFNNQNNNPDRIISPLLPIPVDPISITEPVEMKNIIQDNSNNNKNISNLPPKPLIPYSVTAGLNPNFTGLNSDITTATTTTTTTTTNNNNNNNISKLQSENTHSTSILNSPNENVSSNVNQSLFETNENSQVSNMVSNKNSTLPYPTNKPFPNMPSSLRDDSVSLL